MYGDGAVTDGTCQKWFAKFRAGDFWLDDALQLDRSAEVDNDQIETFIENNQCSTMWEIADILKISKSIKLLLEMKNVSFILRKKPYGLFGQPNSYPHTGPTANAQLAGALTFPDSDMF